MPVPNSTLTRGNLQTHYIGQMSRYFVEFLDLSKSNSKSRSKSKSSPPRSFICTIKLYQHSLPVTTQRVAQLFYPESADSADGNSMTLRKSLVTRVIAPEYLVQFGSAVRKRATTTTATKIPLFDTSEAVQYDGVLKKVHGKRGLLCIADGNSDSYELCIVFVPWGRYTELSGCIVVGECKEWKELQRWMSEVDIDIDIDDARLEIPAGDGVWIGRCGRLIKMEKVEQQKSINSINSNEMLRAVDVMFERK